MKCWWWELSSVLRCVDSPECPPRGRIGVNLCPEMCCRTGRGWASVPRRHASVVPSEQDGRVLEERMGNVIENAALGSLPQGAA